VEVRLNGGESVVPQIVLDCLSGREHMDKCVGGARGEYHEEMNDDCTNILRQTSHTSKSLRRHASSGSLCPDDGSDELFGPHLLNVVQISQSSGRGAGSGRAACNVP
jgi:hypothetical protein